ncbi:MAG TPA: hypothetical protein VEY71_00990 [Chitinophagales bacterium]|nr:hypothetical protein [Chitinophagales bacterium]
MSTITAEEKKERTTGAVVSAVIHALLILLLLMWHLRASEAPGDDAAAGGILINFGTTETGFGDEVPETKVVAPPTPPQPESAPAQKESQVVTQDLEDAPSINTSKEKPKKIAEPKPKPADKPVETKPVEPQKPKLLFPGNRDNAASQGNTQPGGDQGDVKGNPNTNGQAQIDGDNAVGKGGTGIGLNMAGRRITKYPSITDNSQKTGRVVVNIKVDRYGKVIYAKATRQGSTTDDGYLFGLAEKAAFQTQLNSSSDMVEQFGTMTFTFKVK